MPPFAIPPEFMDVIVNPLIEDMLCQLSFECAPYADSVRRQWRAGRGRKVVMMPPTAVPREFVDVTVASELISAPNPW